MLTFGLNPEGSGILGRHLWVRFELQPRKGWSHVGLKVDKTMMVVSCTRGEAGASRLARMGVSQGTTRVTWVPLTGRQLCSYRLTCFHSGSENSLSKR